jgi:hypothetical protein
MQSSDASIRSFVNYLANTTLYATVQRKNQFTATVIMDDNKFTIGLLSGSTFDQIQ